MRQNALLSADDTMILEPFFTDISTEIPAIDVPATDPFTSGHSSEQIVEHFMESDLEEFTDEHT